MPTRRVMVVLGTRPEGVKLAPVILELQKSARGLLPIVCVTGQHREMLDQVLQWFGIVPDLDLNLMQPNQGLAQFASRALIEIDSLLKKIKPEAIIVQGDTTTAMIAALAAFYNGVPVAHVEAGLRTRDLDNPFPEEMNRRVAGVLANFHFAPTEAAVQALLSEQVNPNSVFLTGNTVVDALRMTLARVGETGTAESASRGKTVLVTAHRRESFGSPFESICLAVKLLADRNRGINVMFPVHLNPNVQGPVLRQLSGHPRIHLTDPLRYEQFVGLMSRSDLILTDSGGVQEEAAVLGKPTLIMRDRTERPEAIHAGLAQVVGTDAAGIVKSAERVLKGDRRLKTPGSGQKPFGDGYAARRIVAILSEALVRSDVQAVA